MNNLIFVGEIIAMMSGVVLAYKLLGKEGLFMWVAVATVIANIQVSKNITMLGVDTTVGNVMFATNFLATDILAERYGKKDAKNAVFAALFAVVIYLLGTQLLLLYQPNSMDIVSDAMASLFGLAPRICIASVSMFFLSNLADVYLFEFIKEKTHGKALWFRNNVATVICNCLENYLFFIIGFAGIYDMKTIFIIATTSSIIEALVAVCDTPFLYLAVGGKDGERTEPCEG